jgi:apolipoprotein N-acyltransferase
MRFIPVRLWALAVLSGLLQLLPFPIAGPTPLWRTAFCWVALLPLLAALVGKNREGKPLTVFQGTLLGYACGFLWYLGNCYWIYQTMHLFGGLSKPIAAGILILFSLYLGLYHAIFAGLMTALRRSRFGVQGALLLSPFLWVAVELARARITGLPWDLLGYAQVDNPLLTRLAPITGVYGLSFIIAAVNALWLVRIQLKERRHTRTLLTLTGVVLVLLYVVALRKFQPPVRVPTTAVATLVQHNLSVGAEGEVHESAQDMYNSFTRYSLFPPGMRCNGIPELAGTTCSDPATQRPGYVNGGIVLQPTDLLIWPESPSNFEERDPAFIDAISSLARAAHAPVIAGNIGIVADPAKKFGYTPYNRASFITADGTLSGHYDKMHLVPFGEYTPYKKIFFFAGSLLGDVGLFEPGTVRTVFSTGGHHYGTFICYESIFGDEIRQFADEGADVLINIANDGWYGDTGAAWQHLNMVRMRAIENHRWVLRATNTGVTAAIDPYGRVTSAAPRHILTALRVGFGYEQDITFYSHYGDLFAYFCAFITVLALLDAIRRRRTNKLQPAPQAELQHEMN